jgi:tyrosine-protein kinase Etk/Wzc
MTTNPSTPFHDYQDTDQVNLKDYLQVLWRRRWVIAMVFAAVVAATVAATLLARPLYQASATLEVQKSSRGGAMSLENLFSDELVGMGVEKEINTEVEILKSRTVAADAVAIANFRIVLDRSETVFSKLRRLVTARVQGFFGEEEKDSDAGLLRKDSEPLRTEALELPPLSRTLKFFALFGPDSSFGLLDENKLPLAWGLMGEACKTSLFSFRFRGSAPPEGTSFPLVLRPEINAIDDLRSGLEVAPVRNTRLIRLTLTASHPEDAQRLLESVIVAYQQIKISQKTKMASQALQFIDGQMDEVDAQMQKAMGELKLFKEENQFLDLSESTRASVEQLAELEKSQAELDLLREQSRSLLAALGNQAPLDQSSFYSLGDAMGQPVLASLATELSKLQGERAALGSQFTGRHPALQAADMKIIKLKGKIEAEVKSLISSLEARGAALAHQIKESEKRLERLPEAEKQLAQLTRQAKVFQDNYSFMLQKKGELQVTRASQIGDVWVAETAYAIPGFVKPRPVRNGMLAIVVGLMLGIGLAFILDYMDESLKNDQDVQAVANLAMLGTVGRFSFNGNGHRPSARYLPILDDSKSQLAESFRTLRSNLLFTGVDRPQRTMLFTSPIPGDGKTTCAANLGVGLSQLGKRVLLVDADLRKPALHRAFGLSSTPGIVNVLVEENWQEALDKAIQATQIQNLSLLPCGNVPPNPNEMLGSEKMGQVMEFLSGRYDFVIFDAPPLLAVSDPMVLASRVDGIVLVVRGGQTSRSALKNSMDLLNNCRSKVLGIVLNGIDFKRERYYYDYHSKYYSAYYGHDEKGPETS